MQYGDDNPFENRLILKNRLRAQYFAAIVIMK